MTVDQTVSESSVHRLGSRTEKGLDTCLHECNDSVMGETGKEDTDAEVPENTKSFNPKMSCKLK